MLFQMNNNAKLNSTIQQSTEGKAFIGTSNIVLAGNKSTFPQEFLLKSRLHYYSTVFNSVELNSPFYKVPMSATFEKWSREVTNGFRFTVKLWKGITHVKDLKFNEYDIESFLKKAAMLNDKKGCILLQFPGKITLEYFNKVEEILKILYHVTEALQWRIAVKLRNNSWHTGETFELLDEYNASMVVHDHARARNEGLNKKAGIVYMRFHGPGGNYKGSYTDDFLKQKARELKVWLKDGKDVYAYFNNTAGDAYVNARTLQKLIADDVGDDFHERKH